MTVKDHNKTISIDNGFLTIEDIVAIADNQCSIKLNNDSAFVQSIDAGAELLQRLLQQDGLIYGVTTGYGDSCTVGVPLNLVDELPRHLTRFHGCGLGQHFSHKQARAIMAVRLCSLAKGNSGVSYELLERIVQLFEHDIAPLIPQEGSVGASGDLTPLSYLSAVLVGERSVSYQGKQCKTSEVFNKLNIVPYKLKPKEALALMNGTAVMTALACEAFVRTEYLCRLASRITSLTTLALKANTFHFDQDLFVVKPHPGQIKIADWIRSDVAKYQHTEMKRLQSPYSIRCAPHIIGVVQDSLPWFRAMIENELNSSNDNPIIDVANEKVLHGGHFYGGHIATAMDTMKTQIANLADLLDRQLALLVDTKFNHGLPPNLSFAEPERAMINHGFKAVQIGVSAWTAEALKNTMPASVFSRSTECHNQDKVSMGTIAARDCLRNLELTEQVFAAVLLAASQAVNIRIKRKQLEISELTDTVKTMLDEIAVDFEMLTEDRAMEHELRLFVQKIRDQQWRLYE